MSVLVLHVPVALEDVFLGLRPNYYLLHLCISAKCLNIIHFLCVFPSLPPNLSHHVLLGRSIQKTQHIFSDSYAPRRSRLMFVQGTCSGTGGHTPAAVPPYHCRGRCLPSALHLGRPTWSCRTGSFFCHVQSRFQASVKLTLPSAPWSCILPVRTVEVGGA